MDIMNLPYFLLSQHCTGDCWGLIDRDIWPIYWLTMLPVRKYIRRRHQEFIISQVIL